MNRTEEIEKELTREDLTIEKRGSLEMELEELKKTPEKKTDVVVQQKDVEKKAPIKTWQDAVMALPEKFQQLKLDEKRSTIECGFAMQIIKNNTALQKCDAKTVFDAIIYSARIGLTLNPSMGLAYLVPRGSKCCLDVGYRGWCATLKSYGAIKHMDAYVVYEDENEAGKFSWNPSLGLLHHIPLFAKTEADQKKRVIYGAYAKAMLMDGTDVFEFIPAWELLKIKAVSASASRGFSPYTDWEQEMTRKAPIKRLAKKLLVLQDDDRVKAMFEVEKENDTPDKKKIHEDWTDAEVVA